MNQRVFAVATLNLPLGIGGGAGIRRGREVDHGWR